MDTGDEPLDDASIALLHRLCATFFSQVNGPIAKKNIKDFRYSLFQFLVIIAIKMILFLS